MDLDMTPQEAREKLIAEAVREIIEQEVLISSQIVEMTTKADLSAVDLQSEADAAAWAALNAFLACPEELIILLKHAGAMERLIDNDLWS